PILYYLTSLLTQNNLPAIVCGTTNKDEGSYLGYYGKASDGMVDVQLISDIHKSEVYELGNLLNIPKNITEAAPSGDMFDGKNDEEVFGAPYDFVELYLEYLSIKNKKIKTTIQKTWSAKAKNQFKQLSDNLEALHNYNKHKYLVASPAMHLDIYKYSIPEGWSSKIYA
ncbi:NAD(+) synthase, partial [Candidatus Peregrinibacteria bacterium RIFOXYA12_FULL_33_12]